MGNISKRFNRSEFACKCGCGFDSADIELVGTIEKAADYFLHLNPSAKRVVVHINSGNRCEHYDTDMRVRLGLPPKGQNDKPSEHTHGLAADHWMEYEFENGSRTKIPDDDIADHYIRTYPGRLGIGRYDGRTHLDTAQKGERRWDNRGSN